MAEVDSTESADVRADWSKVFHRIRSTRVLLWLFLSGRSKCCTDGASFNFLSILSVACLDGNHASGNCIQGP